MRADLRRRSLLAAGAAAAPLLAAGCKGVGALGTPPKISREVSELYAAISAEQVMIARYRSAVAAWPALAGTLTPVLGQHQEHLAALRARLIVPAGVPASLVPATRQPATPGAPAQPAAPATVLGTLAAAEEAAAGALTSRLAAVGPSLAQLLASMAASEASHAALLRAARTSR